MRAVSLLWVATCGLATAACTNEIEVGRASYSDMCAGCHGNDGRGDGPNAGHLAVHPADLTIIAAKNGGIFPRVDILSQIDSYAKGESTHGRIPEMSSLLSGRTVLVETADGILTPTPEPSLALSSYLESIQEDRLLASSR